jgi:hypothetical protein
VHLKNPKDFWSGVMFACVGFAFAIMVKYFDYRMGTPVRMGPGYFPFALGNILGVVGVIIILKSLFTTGGAIDKFAWRPLFWILFSIFIFGLTAKILGLPIAVLILVGIATFGGHGFKTKEVVISGVVLAITCTLVFIVGLGLSFPIWPDFDAAKQMFPR